MRGGAGRGGGRPPPGRRAPAVLALLAAACATAASAQAPKRKRAAPPPPASATAPAPAPAPARPAITPIPPLGAPPPRLTLTGLPSATDPGAVCRSACARSRVVCEAADEDCAPRWSTCLAACGGAPRR